MAERSGETSPDYSGVSEYVLPDSRVKRRLDAAVLIAAAGPSIAVIGASAAAIYAEDRHSPLVWTERCMRPDLGTFDMLKLRSLKPGTQNQKPIVTDDDPRITRPGRMLRRTGLDELTQLHHVRKGEMNVVNLRPMHPLDIEKRYEHARRLDVGLAERWWEIRGVALPGITGPAQLAARYGADILTVMQLEIDYIENATLKTDLEILARTACLPILAHTNGTNGHLIDHFEDGEQAA